MQSYGLCVESRNGGDITKNCRKQLDHQMKLANKHEMRYSRRQRKLKTPQATANTPSPRTNTRRLLRCLGGNPSKLQKVKKTLDFHYSLLKDLKNRLAESKDEKERQVIARFFTGSLVMKYKLRNLAKCTTGLSQRRVYGSSFQQKCQTRVYNSEKKKEAHDLYLCDDVSRMTTGIKKHSYKSAGQETEEDSTGYRERYLRKISCRGLQTVIIFLL